jgi:hypothetical protein
MEAESQRKKSMGMVSRTPFEISDRSVIEIFLKIFKNEFK